MSPFALHIKSMPMGAAMQGAGTVHLADSGDTLVVVGTEDHNVCMMLPPEMMDALGKDFRRAARIGRKRRRNGV